MTTVEIYTVDSAPEGSRAALDGLGQRVGFVPNLAATMAGAPALIGGFVSLQAALAPGDALRARSPGGALAGGLEPAEVLEVIAQIGSTTLAALTHNLTAVPLDQAFESRAWETRDGRKVG